MLHPVRVGAVGRGKRLKPRRPPPPREPAQIASLTLNGFRGQQRFAQPVGDFAERAKQFTVWAKAAVILANERTTQVEDWRGTRVSRTDMIRIAEIGNVIMKRQTRFCIRTSRRHL